MAGKSFGGMPLRDYGALLFRKSMVKLRPQEAADELGCSVSYIHKMEEGERPPNLLQWLQIIRASGELDGVKQLVRDLGGVMVRRNGSLAQALRDLAAELEQEEGTEKR